VTAPESGGTIEYPLGEVVIRLEGGMIEVVDRVRGETLRIHVNHAGATIEQKRDGSLRVKIGWPKRWVYGMEAGPGADLIWDDIQPDGRGDFTVEPQLGPTIRGFLAEAAARRTLPLPGSPMP